MIDLRPIDDDKSTVMRTTANETAATAGPPVLRPIEDDGDKKSPVKRTTPPIAVATASPVLLPCDRRPQRRHRKTVGCGGGGRSYQQRGSLGFLLPHLVERDRQDDDAGDKELRRRLREEEEREERQELERELERLKLANSRLVGERDEAVRSLHEMHRQQQSMYDDFKLLRDKYDDLKGEMQRVLWEYIPSMAAASSATAAPSPPPLHCDWWDSFGELSNVDGSVFETPDRVGEYEIGRLLGEGQYADVKLCRHSSTGKECAVKILPKKKVVSLAGLRRVHREISALKRIRHPNVVKLLGVINSPKCVYVLTEIGGRDLFEFFDRNPGGVHDEAAREIVAGIALPLAYLHECGICHRDLKPENVLLMERRSSDGSSGAGGGGSGGVSGVSHRDVRLCDFGQCAAIAPPSGRAAGGDNNACFSDLCGSPGFFAPEMILSSLSVEEKGEDDGGSGEGQYNYSGPAADVWSLGCIALELTRGHDEFCASWMTSYNYDILQDEDAFRRCLGKAVERIQGAAEEASKEAEADGSGGRQKMTTSAAHAADFLARLLTLDPNERIDSKDILAHAWIREVLDAPSSCDGSSGSEAEGEKRQLIEEERKEGVAASAASKSASESKDVGSALIAKENSKNEGRDDSPKKSESTAQQSDEADSKRSLGDSEDDDSSTCSGRQGSKRNIFFRNSLSNRARKHFAGTDESGERVVVSGSLFDDLLKSCSESGGSGRAGGGGGSEIRLPPIEPRTPSSKAAMRALRRGEKIVQSFVDEAASSLAGQDVVVESGTNFRPPTVVPVDSS